MTQQKSMADWPTVWDTLQTTVLPIWDARCPDDGRPAVLLAACRAYCTQPTAATAARLAAARQDAWNSEDMVGECETDGPPRAWAAVLVLLVCSRILVEHNARYNQFIGQILQKNLNLPAIDLPSGPVIP